MILAFESTCDESSIALFHPKKGIVGHWVKTQSYLHRNYGGFVPKLAIREHLECLVSLLDIAYNNTYFNGVNKIAVAFGPGFTYSLAIGIYAAQAYALACNLPLYGVNHLLGHAFSPFIKLHFSSLKFFFTGFLKSLPHLGLLVTGGNTILFTIDKYCSISVIAKTMDDAAGEALDKASTLLGLSYPGGPLIEALASNGNPYRFILTLGIRKRYDFRFSFSGLKTNLRKILDPFTTTNILRYKSDICASYQKAIILQLLRKSEEAILLAKNSGTSYASIGLSGGVANNNSLRYGFKKLGNKYGLPVFTAKHEYAGDNAAMIAFAAWIDSTNTRYYAFSLDPSISL